MNIYIEAGTKITIKESPLMGNNLTEVIFQKGNESAFKLLLHERDIAALHETLNRYIYQEESAPPRPVNFPPPPPPDSNYPYSSSYKPFSSRLLGR